jgi:hypothetical protein
MDNEYLKQMIEELQNGVKSPVTTASTTEAPKKRRTRAKSTPKEEIEVAAPEAPEEEEAPVAAAPKRRGRKKAAATAETQTGAPRKSTAKKRAPIKRAATSATTAPPWEGSEITKLSDMVEAIGTKVFDLDGALHKEISDVSDQVTSLEEMLTAINDYLTWTYNNEIADPGNEISSLTDIGWTD